MLIASIVQRIGRELPELKIGVQFPLGALNKNLADGQIF